MPHLSNKEILTDRNQISNIFFNDIDNVKQFINTANSRLDAIISVTKNSHAIAADAVTAMICENQDSLSSKNSVNTTNKMSVCLRDGEIIIRYITYLLITNDISILERSCLKDLKETYVSLGVPLSNAVRVMELIRDSTISDIKTTANLLSKEKSYLNELVYETESYFQKIIDLFN